MWVAPVQSRVTVVAAHAQRAVSGEQRAGEAASDAGRRSRHGRRRSGSGPRRASGSRPCASSPRPDRLGGAQRDRARAAPRPRRRSAPSPRSPRSGLRAAACRQARAGKPAANASEPPPGGGETSVGVPAGALPSPLKLTSCRPVASSPVDAPDVAGRAERASARSARSRSTRFAGRRSSLSSSGREVVARNSLADRRLGDVDFHRGAPPVLVIVKDRVASPPTATWPKSSASGVICSSPGGAATPVRWIAALPPVVCEFERAARRCRSWSVEKPIGTDCFVARAASSFRQRVLRAGRAVAGPLWLDHERALRRRRS